MRIGLVLGAGGVTGSSYMAGALTALEQDLGWDARTADVIVGTSAGALAGALLRRGVPASDLAAWAVGAPLSRAGEVLLGSIDRPAFDPVDLRAYLRVPRLPHPRAVMSVLRHPMRFDPLRALMTHVADGARDLSFTNFLGTGWPRDAYLCCAVRRVDGHRVVFGGARRPRDGLGAAVAASCAIPGYFAPVKVDGEFYIDGGVASATNADVLASAELDAVIAVAPMSAEHLPRQRSFERAIRERTRSALAGEMARLERRGMRCLTIAPGPEALQQMAGDFMSDEFAAEIVRSAFLETGQQLQDPRRLQACA